MDNNSLDPNRNISIKYNANPITPYWTYLGWFVLLAFGVSFIKTAVHLSLLVSGSESVFLYITADALFVMAIWTFIGFELNRLKEGLIAGGIYLTGYVISFIPNNELVPGSDSIHVIAAVIYFAFATIDNNKKRGLFAILAYVCFKGLYIASYSHQLSLMDTWGPILREIGIPSHYFSDLFTIQFNVYDSSFSSIDYSNDIGVFLSVVILFMLITYAWRYFQSDDKFSMRSVDLRKPLSKKLMLIVVPVFYMGIAFIAWGLVGAIINWLMLYDYSFSFLEISSYQLWLFNLDFLARYICGVLFLIMAAWLFRKMLVEYYLQNRISLGWNYYLSLLPIIGLVVWIINFSKNANETKLSENEIKLLPSRDQSLPVVLLAFTLLFMVWSLGQSQGGPIVLGFLFVALLVYALYLYHPIGIYIIIGLNVLYIIALIFVEVFNGEVPNNALSIGFFWSVIQYMILYPVFHLNQFQIVLSHSDEEEE